MTICYIKFDISKLFAYMHRLNKETTPYYIVPLVPLKGGCNVTAYS